jgi:DNA polymerase elongation subunit (family B)
VTPSGKPLQISHTPKLGKNGKAKEEKRMTGGRVMEPIRGEYNNMLILDFNSLYPNLMIRYKLDPALLVLDPKYANCPGVEYVDVKFSDKCSFRFAQSKNGVPYKGVIIQHTANLVASRKVAQGHMGKYDAMLELERAWLLKSLNAEDQENVTKYSDAATSVETDPTNLFATAIKQSFGLIYNQAKNVSFDKWQDIIDETNEERAKEKRPPLNSHICTIIERIYTDAYSDNPNPVDTIGSLIQLIGNAVNDWDFLTSYKVGFTN